MQNSRPSAKRSTARVARLITLFVAAMVAGCGSSPSATVAFTPAATGFTTYALSGGTIDPIGPCNVAMPPAIPSPAPPASAEVLVGFQDWRNTSADASGTVCMTSNARRFEGVATFDMSAVLAEIDRPPRPTVVGTLTYNVGPSTKTPASAAGLVDICLRSVELAAAAPAMAGLVPLNYVAGAEFPASAPPSLGIVGLPATAPVGAVTSAGAATVNTTGSVTSVSVDVSLLLWDWAARRTSTLSLVFKPRGVPLGAVGIRNATPVPVSRPSDQCVSILKDLALTVRADHPPLVWRDLSVGLGAHVCAVKQSGQAFCWGSNEHGQLGADAPPACSRMSPVPKTYECSRAPVPVQCGATPCQFTAITAGATHTCALDTSQYAWCWGNNLEGELGLGGTAAMHPGGETPQKLVNGPQFATISAGGFHTCGVTPAGQVYCWGVNGTGQVGSAASMQIREPVLVPVPGKVRSVAASWSTTCAVDEDGIMYCWGLNLNELVSNTIAVDNPLPGCNCTATPMRVQGTHFPAMDGKLVDIAAPGATTTCAHVTTGETICWGLQAMGTTLPATQSARQLTTGWGSACALVGQQAICWGDGNSGQLGDGDFHNGVLSAIAPVPTVTPPMGFLQIDAGIAAVCGISDLQDIYCWGANHDGKLGDGTMDWRSVPTKVVFP